jgi:hypothetical protein
VEALLASFRPACPFIATLIPGGDSQREGLHYLEERGVWIAERGPAGNDGGGYLYLLGSGALAELVQWPNPLDGTEGWIGQLHPIGVRSALARFAGLRPHVLARTLTVALSF